MAADEYLRCSRFACNRAHGSSGRIFAQNDFFVSQAFVLQGFFGFSAERAARFGEYGNRRLFFPRRIDGFQHGVRIGYFKRIAVFYRLYESFFNHAVFNQHRVTPRAVAEAQLVFRNQHAHAACEFAIAVRYDGDVFGFLIGQPCVHHKSVVYGYAQNAVHAAFEEFFGQFVVARQVGRRASRGKCTGQGEYDHGFAFKQVVGRNVYPSVALAGVEYDGRDFGADQLF